MMTPPVKRSAWGRYKNPRIMKLTQALAVVLLAGATAQAQVFTFVASLDGPSEAPPNASPATGSTTMIFDATANILTISASFTGLMGNTTAAHIHAPTAVGLTGTAGVAVHSPSLAGFPLGVTSGSYSMNYDLASTGTYHSTFLANNGGTVTSAEAALLGYLQSGRAYLNIHTAAFPGGEIRGFLTPVPEPATTAALAGGALGAFALVRRLRSRAA
jgi:hypothetical protein